MSHTQTHTHTYTHTLTHTHTRAHPPTDTNLLTPVRSHGSEALSLDLHMAKSEKIKTRAEHTNQSEENKLGDS